jgi:hypothetical protein
MEDIDRVRSRQVTTLTPSKPKPAKYRNVKVTDESGVVHDSTKQYRRWLDLELRQRAGEISQLHREPVFDLIVNGQLVCKYIADASYVENATGEKVVEDTKSEITRKNRVYRLKAKLLRACHGIEVRET